MRRCRRRWRRGDESPLSRFRGRGASVRAPSGGGERRALARAGDVEALHLEDLAGVDPAFDQLGPGQGEDPAVGEDRPRIAVPVDARDLAAIARDSVLVVIVAAAIIDPALELA